MNPDNQREVSIDVITNSAGISRDAVTIYREAFKGKPYFEKFTPGEAREALVDILRKKGDLLIGRQDGQAVAIAGGYPRPDGTYYLAELAVRPDKQDQGIGRIMFRAQLEAAAKYRPSRIDLRTSIGNVRGRAIYRDEGFKASIGNTVVSQLRQNGQLALDERLYMYRPPITNAERLATLRQVAIVYPSGNTTAVVFDQLLDTNRKTLNDKVMNAWQKRSPAEGEVEQCCFVTLPRNPNALARVEMFGGEFCGNATRSAIWLLTKGQDYRGLIEVSGAGKPLPFEVKDKTVSVEMPLPTSKQLTTQTPEGTLVQLDGIAQLVVSDPLVRKSENPRQMLERLIKSNAYNLAEQPAVGVSYYDPTSGKAMFCVWVKQVRTIFDETACGSGTCAIGIAAATQGGKSVGLNVVQPSGETITTNAKYKSGRVTKATIAGQVKVLYEGELKL